MSMSRNVARARTMAAPAAARRFRRSNRRVVLTLKPARTEIHADRKVARAYIDSAAFVRETRMRLRNALAKFPEEKQHLAPLVASLGEWLVALKRARREAGL